MSSRTVYKGQAPTCTLPTTTSIQNEVLSADGSGGSQWTSDIVVASLNCPTINSTNITATNSLAADTISATTSITCAGQITAETLSATDTVEADTMSATTAITCDGQITTLDAVQAPRGIIKNFATVTQSTSITTPVTLTTQQGVITTATTTLAAGASANFTLSNGNINSEIVNVFVSGYTGVFGTNGWPVAHSYSSAVDSCEITVTNTHPTNALSGELTIVYQVLRSIPSP